MNCYLFLFILAIGLWSGCNKDDDEQDCILLEYIWNIFIFESQGSWFWVIDIFGVVIVCMEVES